MYFSCTCALSSHNLTIIDRAQWEQKRKGRESSMYVCAWSGQARRQQTAQKGEGSQNSTTGLIGKCVITGHSSFSCSSHASTHLHEILAIVIAPEGLPDTAIGPSPILHEWVSHKQCDRPIHTCKERYIRSFDNNFALTR